MRLQNKGLHISNPGSWWSGPYNSEPIVILDSNANDFSGACGVFFFLMF